MNLFFIAILLTLLPLTSQILFGWQILIDRIRFKLYNLTFLNVIFQFILSYLSTFLVVFDIKEDDVNCGMPQTVLIFVVFIELILLFLVAFIQQVVMYYTNKRQEKNET